MAYRCDISVERLKEDEDCGFLTICGDRCYEFVIESSIKKIYMGHLNAVIYNDSAVFSKINPADIHLLIDAVLSDIDENMWDIEYFESEGAVKSFENIKDAYTELCEFLAPCTWE